MSSLRKHFRMFSHDRFISVMIKTLRDLIFRSCFPSNLVEAAVSQVSNCFLASSPTLLLTESPGGGGWCKQQSFIREGSAPRSKPLPFYVPFLIAKVLLSYSFHRKLYHFPALSNTSAHEIPTLLNTSSLKKVPLSGGASPYSPE